MSDEGLHMTEERLLIERAQKGDKYAFRELVEVSKENVFRLAYDLTGNRHDATGSVGLHGGQDRGIRDITENDAATDVDRALEVIVTIIKLNERDTPAG